MADFMKIDIYQSIALVMDAIKPIAKSSEFKGKTNSFKYRGIEAVMNELNPAMAAVGMFMVPEVLDLQREQKTSSTGGVINYSIAKIKYHFYASDGSQVEAVVVGEGMDSGDKSMNKAMSAAFKYACFQVFCIPTEDMHDSEEDEHEVVDDQVAQMYEDAKTVIDGAKRTSLMKEATRTGYPESSILSWLKVDKLEDITIEKYNFAMSKLANVPSV